LLACAFTTGIGACTAFEGTDTDAKADPNPDGSGDVAALQASSSDGAADAGTDGSSTSECDAEVVALDFTHDPPSTFVRDIEDGGQLAVETDGKGHPTIGDLMVSSTYGARALLR